MASVRGVYVGRVRMAAWEGRRIATAFRKHPVDGPVAVGTTGLAGDEQGDLRHHGGPDKAICVYPAEHYEAVEQWLGTELDEAAFGENLTTSGLLETQVVVGAVYAVGTAVVQVSQPRRPCFKIAMHHAASPRARWLPLELQRSGRTGCYLRVLQPGRISVDDPITLLDAPCHRLTLAEINRVMNVDRDDVEGIHRLLAARAHLPARWVASLTARLNGAPVAADAGATDRERLAGPS